MGRGIRCPPTEDRKLSLESADVWSVSPSSKRIAEGLANARNTSTQISLRCPNYLINSVKKNKSHSDAPPQFLEKLTLLSI